MESVPTYERVMKVLEGHRRGHYNIQETVNLLEAVWKQESEEGRKVVERTIWATLSREPLTARRPIGNLRPDILRVVIRAISTFGSPGSTAQLPGLVFGRLPWRRPERMGVWAQSMCHELSYSMLHHAGRFTEVAFMQAREFCGSYTSPSSAEFMGTEIPQVVSEAAANLEQTIEHIEFKKFAEALTEGQQPVRSHTNELQALLAATGIRGEIASAMEKAEAYLEGNGAFDAKHAADLIRACMEETHRGVIAELEKMTGQQCAGPGKDGARRAYMRQMEFINDAEDQFFSSIYTLLSREGTHKLLAPKETALVMYRTVKDYLSLLLRRLRDKKEAMPEAR